MTDEQTTGRKNVKCNHNKHDRAEKEHYSKRQSNSVLYIRLIYSTEKITEAKMQSISCRTLSQIEVHSIADR